MKSLAAFCATTVSCSAAFAAMVAAPAALACPGSHACGSCGVGFGSYVSAVSVGLLIGVGSVAIENLVRARRR